MIRIIALMSLMGLPGNVLACSGYYTYDLANPLIFDFEFSPKDQYVLGRVVEIADVTAEPYALLTIEVLADYRFPKGERTVQAFANTVGPCSPRAFLGQYAKFGISQKDGKPRLINAPVVVF